MRPAITAPGVATVVVVMVLLAFLAYLSTGPAVATFGDLVRGHGGTAAEAEGGLPAGVTVFDDRYPGVANLDPDLLHALRTAAGDAARDGVKFQVNSGWRAPAYQDRLLREAIAKYGSEQAAARWVAPVNKSAHVSGDAVDIGPDTAESWLSEHGTGYGLCQIYANEPWHFELRPGAIGRGCPAQYADAAQDPRMGS